MTDFWKAQELNGKSPPLKNVWQTVQQKEPGKLLVTQLKDTLTEVCVKGVFRDNTPKFKQSTTLSGQKDYYRIALGSCIHRGKMSHSEK